MLRTQPRLKPTLGFGVSSLIAGGFTALGGVGYAIAVKVRGYYNDLAARDLAQFKIEEQARIAGTNRFTGIYLGAAIQGIGLFVIDLPGAGRASKYQDDVRRFVPQVGISPGGGNRPWAATLSRSF